MSSVTALNFLFTMPQEILDVVKDDVIREKGEEYWRISCLSADMVGSVSWDADFPTFLHEAVRCFDVSGDHQTFSDRLVDELGHGFCYLFAVEPIHRQNLLKFRSSFCTLQTLISHHGDEMRDFHVFISGGPPSRVFGVVSAGQPAFETLCFQDPDHYVVKFQSACRFCNIVKVEYFWEKFPILPHREDCQRSCMDVYCSPDNDGDLELMLGGFSSFFQRSQPKQGSTSSSSRAKRITESLEHEKKQVLGFRKSVKGDGAEPDMTRDLFSVPKPEKVETMTDHISSHVGGDMFPYLAVVGNEEESKDSRLARLRAFRSPYGKENKPEMRINGVILDELEGTILVQHLKEHVDAESLSRSQVKQNKKFKPLVEASFKKPYLLISRITGEYVPLMSSSADYTDLYFTLEDGRLLDHQTIVQSDKIPSNQNGVFELSCDYCISTKDLSQLSLKYFLSRPIMKDGFQWGSVSLTIRMSEADTPYLIPKVEAMAIVRAPYTTFEEHTKDPDHADVVFTSAQVPTFREMYKSGDIVDVDEPKRVRTKRSSYSKSTIRGIPKGEKGPTHFEEQEGWEHLKGMRKPNLPEDQASVDVESVSEEVDEIIPNQTTKAEYERQQELLRRQFHHTESESTEEVPDHEAVRSSSPSSERPTSSMNEILTPKSALKKKVLRFQPPEQLEGPDTSNVFQFD